MKKQVDRLFKLFCNSAYYDDIRGDLEELYNEKRQTHTHVRADLYYVWEILLLFRLSLMRPSLFSHLFTTQYMFRNNLKTALRYMWHQKSFSAIKIFGLSLGIAAFLVLSIHIQDQLSYDNFYPNKDRIYRVTAKYMKEGFSGVDFPAPLSKALVEDYPEVEQAGRFIASSWLNQVRSINQSQNILEEKIAFVDPELLDILSLPVVHGNCVQSMQEPNTVVISKTKAEFYFSNENPIGQLLIFNNNKDNPYRVVGVFEDLPSHSHLDVEFMITLKGVEFWPGEQSYWGANMYSVYTLLHPQTDIPSFNEKMEGLIPNYFLPSWKERDFADPQEIADNITFELQAIQDIYLGSSEIRDDLKHGDLKLLWLFGISAGLIVIISMINFINLSVARYSLRIKELSMRKILGASTRQLIHQILTEALLYSFFSFSIGLILALLSLPFFGQLMGHTLTFPFSLFWSIPLFLLGILVLGLLTGIYPAIFLSSLQTASRKLKVRRGSSSLLFQRFLIFFQFVVSATLIICTIAVLQQMKLIKQKDVGFDKEQIVVIKGAHALSDKMSVFKETVQQMAGVEQVTTSDYFPMENSRRYSDSFWQDGTDKTASGTNAQIWQVDPDYIQTLGIRMVAGRNFQEEMSSDSSSILISQSLARKLQIEAELGGLITNKEQTWRVIGIFDDFHFESFKHDISPVCLVLGEQASMMAVKVHSGQTQQIVQSIKNTWSSMVPFDPFRYEFLDESFTMMHKDVIRSSQLFNIFSSLAIIIACMGLFGLTIFNTDQRKREFGIRKVLGAKVSQIIVLVSKDYMSLVVLANLAAIPLGWYLINRLLENFAYRADINWDIFLLSTSLSFCIAFLTISTQSIQAALKNPIESIKEG